MLTTAPADSDRPISSSAAWPLWIEPLVLGVVALVWRLVRLDQESFFTDEVVTGMVISGPVWKGLLELETSPPLYFWMAKLWAMAVPGGLTGLRALSAVGGALVAPAAWWTARRMGMSLAAARLTGLMLALSSMLLWYGQQARSYALLATVASLWLGAAASCVTRPSRTCQVGLVAVLMAGFSLHYYFAFAVGGGVVALAVLWTVRRTHWPSEAWGRCVLLHAIAMIGWLVWLPLFRAQAAAGRYQWMPRPGWADLGKAFTDGMIGGPFQHLQGWGLSVMLTLYALAVAAWIVGGAARWRRENRPKAVRVAECVSPVPWSILLLGVVAGATVAPFLLSQGERVIFLGERYSIVALPALLLWLAWTADRLPWRVARRGALAVCAILFLSLSAYLSWIYWARYQEFDWKGAARVLEAEWRPGDAVVFFPGWLADAYRANGGVRWGELTPRSGRIWEMVWLGDAGPEHQKLWAQWHARPAARMRIQFPHIQLWEIPNFHEADAP